MVTIDENNEMQVGDLEQNNNTQQQFGTRIYEYGDIINGRRITNKSSRSFNRNNYKSTNTDITSTEL